MNFVKLMCLGYVIRQTNREADRQTEDGQTDRQTECKRQCVLLIEQLYSGQLHSN